MSRILKKVTMFININFLSYNNEKTVFTSFDDIGCCLVIMQ